MLRFRQPISLFVLVVVLLLLRFKPTLVGGQQQQQQRVTSFAERLALIRLRSSLGLRAKQWPIKSDPCLTWEGIQCANGSVVGINISGFRRTRVGSKNPQFAVDSISNLTRLATFNASFFPLPGNIPDWFGQKMGNLQVLDLSSCSIQGTVPFSLGNLSSLSTLILSKNALKGIVPPSLGQSLHLSVLDLSQNSLTGSIPDSFSSLHNLSFLDLSSNFLSGPIPPGIGILSNLRTLNFSNNSLNSDIPPQLGDLRSLVDLDLGSNSLGSTLPSDLSGLKNLRTMSLRNNKLSGPLPDGLFKGLTRLEVVLLSHNNFSGAVPDSLWSMPTLQLVDVSSNSFTGTLPQTTLTANATTTAVFNLSDNEYYGGITSVLQRFGLVDLSGNYFEGQVPDFMRGISSLRANCLQNATEQRARDDCASFYTSKGLVFDNFGLPGTNVTPEAGNVPHKHSHKRTIILAAVLGGVGLVLLLLLLLLLITICTRRKGGTRQIGNGVGPIPTTAAGSAAPGGPINITGVGEGFTYEQLLQATGNFGDANLLKKGHSGDLYRGELEGGIPVAVKKVNLNSVKRESYLAELDFFSKVSHPRLVPLLGYCLEKENEKFLVYKYMPNGDLSSSLFKKVNTVEEGLQSLDWITRLKIATGAAEGLAYLHHECTPPFVHRDVQASSILLDDKFEVRLGSLSEVSVQGGETQPGVITRLLRLPTNSSDQGASGSQQSSSCAHDVYCFGKVLLELVTGKLGISGSNDASVKEFLDQTLPHINIYDKELVTKIVDPSLIYDEDLLEEVWAMAIVARSCLSAKPGRRPLMRNVLKALENPFKVVRDDSAGSGRLRATSSRGSSVWGSWRQSSDVAPAAARGAEDHPGSMKRMGTFGSQSQGSGPLASGPGGGPEYSASQRRQSREIFPEPLDPERHLD